LSRIDLELQPAKNAARDKKCDTGPRRVIEHELDF
jgi:hypothetical protein